MEKKKRLQDQDEDDTGEEEEEEIRRTSGGGDWSKSDGVQEKGDEEESSPIQPGDLGPRFPFAAWIIIIIIE